MTLDIVSPFKTIPAMMSDRAQKFPEKPYLIFGEKTYTYSQFDLVTSKAAGAFKKLGVMPGDRIAILIPNSDDFLFCYFGAMKAGCAAATLNTLLKAEELEFIINDSMATVLCTTPHYLKLLSSVQENLTNIKHIILTEPAETGTFQILGDAITAAEPFTHNVQPDDDAAMIYTSGTTGHPKGVVLTHANILYNSYVAPRFIDLQKDDVSLCIMPLFHVNAQIASMMATMQAGATVVLEEMFKPRSFIKTLKKYKCTTFSGVPTIYSYLNDMKEAEGEDLSFLKACICGAAPMPVEVFQTFERKFGAKIIEGYGLSEGTCVSSLNPINGVRKIGSIGIPIDGQEMGIWDDDGNSMPVGQIGEIVIKGPNVMKGYYNNPEASAKALSNGWLRTGDLGYRDQDGYYFISGRKKEMIIRGGENIYPREIEEVLYEMPDVQDCAVVGLPDKKYGEEVAAFIILKGGSSADEKAIKNYLRTKIADFKRPRIIEIVTDLPRTATGKIQKNKIVEEHVGNMQLISKVDGKVLIPYKWVYGKTLARFYSGMKEEGKFYGTYRKGCTRCNDAVQCPPKSYCGICHEECKDWKELPNRGVLESFTTVYMEFPGQPTKPPYTYGYIKLEGASTHLYHMIREIEEKDIRVGMKVEPVWTEQEKRKGNLYDIQYFRPLKS
ncbi:MAG: long-chain-fatty-acid--CoA ligase [Leptospirales bacterium]|nr:long-chain-fatty-acid--CoA ligase [Leptospirales bacterium]